MFTSHLLFHRDESALLAEKADKLFGIAKYLDSFLGEEITHEMYNLLAPVVDRVCESFDGLGAGYYSKELDCIIVYGPTRIYSSHTGMSVNQDHAGWRCMNTRRPIMSLDSMVSKEVLNCVIPIIRNNTVLGFIWANETVEDIYKQVAHNGMNVFLSPGIEPLVGLSGLVMLSCRTLLTGEKPISHVQSYLKLFLNSLQFSVIITDREGILRFASKKLEDLGLALEDLVDCPADEIYPALGLSWEKILTQLRTSGGNYQIQTKPLGPRRIEMNVLMAPLIDDQNNWLGVVTLLQETTLLQREEERIVRAEVVYHLEELAATMIHEIQNPLTILREAIRIIPKRLENKQYLEKFSEVALEEINQIERIGKSLAEFMRYSLPEFLEFDIVEMVQKAVNLARGMAEEQNVNVVENYEYTESLICGDPEYLHQALVNLILNSLEAMPEGGTLTISITEGKDSKLLYIKIKDTGPGIRPEMEKAIFRPFYTTKAKGTGIGLALVQSIISHHNGFLFLEPGYGSGAIFSIGLPRQQVLQWVGLKGEEHL